MKSDPPVAKNTGKQTGKKDKVCPSCNLKGKNLLKASGICQECHDEGEKQQQRIEEENYRKKKQEEEDRKREA